MPNLIDVLCFLAGLIVAFIATDVYLIKSKRSDLLDDWRKLRKL